MAKKRTTKKTRRTSKATTCGDSGVKRDAKGHFVKGTACLSPGNPQWARIAEYREALRKACTPTDLRAVIRKMVSLAKEGDMIAAKVLLDRALGRATAAPANPDAAAAVDLPTLATTKDTVAASNAVLQALSDGRLNADTAAKYATVIELARRTLETHDLAERLALLEAEAGQER